MGENFQRRRNLGRYNNEEEKDEYLGREKVRKQKKKKKR